LLLALALELDDAVLAVGLEVTDSDFGQLLDAAGGEGQDGEQDPVAEADGGVGRGASRSLRQSRGAIPTVLPSRGTAEVLTKSGWAGLAPSKP
jgi:hypothetical protein